MVAMPYLQAVYSGHHIAELTEAYIIHSDLHNINPIPILHHPCLNSSCSPETYSVIQGHARDERDDRVGGFKSVSLNIRRENPPSPAHLSDWQDADDLDARHRHARRLSDRGDDGRVEEVGRVCRRDGVVEVEVQGHL